MMIVNKYECTVDQELTSYALGRLAGSHDVMLCSPRMSALVHLYKYINMYI